MMLQIPSRHKLHTLYDRPSYMLLTWLEVTSETSIKNHTEAALQSVVEPAAQDKVRLGTSGISLMNL